MSKKLSFILLLSVTLLFITTIIGILIFRITDTTKRNISAYDQLAVHENTDATQPQSINGKININTATHEDLLELPGIGDALAERIIEYRQMHGNFSSVDELIEVSGIGSAKLNNIKDYITVGG